MRRGLILLWLFSMALAQSLVVPPEAPVGAPAPVHGEGFPPGAYALEVELPGGEERVFTVEAPEGRFTLPFVPEAPGTYRFRIRLDGSLLEGMMNALLPAPRLVPEGLWLGPGRVLALPEPERWLGPVVAGTKAYVARGLLVLEVDRLTGKVVRHYPPSPVRQLFEGPELLLEDGRRLGLKDLKALPFEAPWGRLSELSALERALGPYEGYRPYWSLLAEGRTDEGALLAMGKDLFQRGHRVELAWGKDHPFGPLLAAARAARKEGIEPSLALIRFLFDHVPLLPGSEAFFAEAADWLWAQGRVLEAERLREGIGWIRHYRPLGLLRAMGFAFLLFAALYLALLLKGLITGGRFPGGGLLFFERVLLVFFLLLAGAAGVGYGLFQKAEGSLAKLDRGTLKTLAAGEAIRALPEGPERRALLAGEGEAPSAALLLGAGKPARALAFDSASGAVRERIGIGSDPWSGVYREALSKRPLVPSARELELTFARAYLRDLLARPWPTLSTLFGSPPLFALYLAVFLLLLLHALIILVRGQARPLGPLAWLLSALFPGLYWFGYGVGIVLFGVALAGALALWAGRAEGLWVLLFAYLLNLAGLAVAYPRGKR